MTLAIDHAPPSASVPAGTYGYIDSVIYRGCCDVKRVPLIKMTPMPSSRPTPIQLLGTSSNRAAQAKAAKTTSNPRKYTAVRMRLLQS